MIYNTRDVTMDNQQLRHCVYDALLEGGQRYIGYKSYFSCEELMAYETSNVNQIKPVMKCILAHFESAKEAWQYEQSLIKDFALCDAAYANKAMTPWANILRGEARSEAHKQNISSAVKLAMADEAVRSKISAGVKSAQQKNGHPRKGAKLSSEQCAKMVATRLANDGYTASNEAKAKIALASSKTWANAESANKIKAAQHIARIARLERCIAEGKTWKGFPASDEQIASYISKLNNVKFNDQSQDLGPSGTEMGISA